MVALTFFRNELMECAKAIKVGNLNSADTLLAEIRSLTSIEANKATRKVVNYFAEALVRRVYGWHPRYPLLLVPSTNLYDLYYYLFTPFCRFAYTTTKHVIVHDYTGSRKLHVIDFSIMLQPWRWYYVMKELAKRPGGLPSFRITSVVPKLSKNFDYLRDMHCKMTKHAKQLGIELELRHCVANNSAADIVKCISRLKRSSEDEMLVVNWEYSLHKLLAQEGAIDQVLSKVKDLRPDMMVIVEKEANHNGPDFLDRLVQSFQYYSVIFESLEKDNLFYFADNKEMWERYFRRQIGNLVACEGTNRVERHQSLDDWQHHLSRAGFNPVRQWLDKWDGDWPPSWSEYRIEERDDHALLCRHNCPLATTSVWKLSDPTPLNSGNAGNWDSILASPVLVQDAIDKTEVLRSCDSDSEDEESDDHNITQKGNTWSIMGFSMNQIAASAKIFDILENICHVHKLPLALTWISYGGEGNQNSKGKHMLRIDDNACYVNDVKMEEFGEACAKHHLEEGQGTAGKALQSNIHFECNLSSLDAVDCPFVADACKFGLHAAIAIKLMSTHDCNDVYILEFFLPKDMKEISEQEALIDALSSTLQKNCRNLWIVCGRELTGTSSSEVRFEDARMPNTPPESVSRIMATGTFNAIGTDEVETHGPLEQGIEEQNAVVTSALYSENELVSMDGSHRITVSNKRRKISGVWEGFRKHGGENGEVWATCKYCTKQYRAESTRGTSNLHKHLKKCLANRQGGAEEQPSEIGHSRTTAVRRNAAFDQERSRLDIARMMMKHGYPLDMVQDEFFRTFVNNLQPMFKPYPQDIVEADVLVVSEEEKEKLKKYLETLSCLFSLTIELRSSDDKKMTYCCLILHFVDDGWQPKKKILAFRNLQYNCDAEAIQEIIAGVLTAWKMNKKVHFIFIDATPPNDHLIRELKTKLSDPVSLVHGDFFYVSCYAQVLVLLIEEGLYEIRSPLYRIRESIEYVHGTPLGRRKFEEAMNQVKLQDKKLASLDVRTRWDTTFLMLENALALRKAFDQLEQINGDFKANPSMEEWRMATVLYECLKVFHKSMTNFPASIEDYFLNACDVYKNLSQWGKSEHMYVRAMAGRMKMKFDEYWCQCSLPLGISVVLNPCFKFDLVEYVYQQMYGNDAYSHLSRFHHNLTSVYQKYVHDISNLAPSTSANADLRSSTSGNPKSEDKVRQFNEWRKHKYQCSVAESGKSELDRYLEQPPVTSESDSKILAWWHANAQKFPVLGKMARDFLAMPMSSIVSKACLSEEFMKLDPGFDGLRPEIVEALICGKNWLESPRR